MVNNRQQRQLYEKWFFDLFKQFGCHFMRFDFRCCCCCYCRFVEIEGSLTATIEQNHIHFVEMLQKASELGRVRIFTVSTCPKVTANVVNENVETFSTKQQKWISSREQNIIYVIYDRIKSHAKWKANIWWQFFLFVSAFWNDDPSTNYIHRTNTDILGRIHVHKMGARFAIRKRLTCSLRLIRMVKARCERNDLSSQVERKRITAQKIRIFHLKT